MTAPVRPIRPRAALLLCVLASAAQAAGPAHAAPTAEGLSLEPVGGSVLRFQSTPGHRLSGAVRVVNRSRHGRDVRLQVTDLESAATGGIAFPAARPRATGTWLRLGLTSVHLGPGQSQIVTFTGRVPKGARAGQHFAGVVAVDTAQLTGKARASSEGVRVRQMTRLATPIQVDLPGPLTGRLNVEDVRIAVDAGGAALAMELRNTGTRLLRTTAVNLRVEQNGHTLFRHRDRLLELVPDSAIAYPVAWPTASVAMGTYRVVGTLRPEGVPPVTIDRQVRVGGAVSRKLERSTGVAALPDPGKAPMWMLALLGASLALAGLSIAAYMRARRRLPVGTTR
jgi:hypothetical protein